MFPTKRRRGTVSALADRMSQRAGRRAPRRESLQLRQDSDSRHLRVASKNRAFPSKLAMAVMLGGEMGSEEQLREKSQRDWMQVAIRQVGGEPVAQSQSHDIVSLWR